MRVPSKRVVSGLTIAAVSTAVFFAAMMPASATIAKPPSTAMITISAPIKAQKIAGVQPVTVRSIYPGTQAVWITFYKAQVPEQTVAAVQDPDDATLYHYDWDTLTWPFTSATVSASAVANGVQIAVAKTRIPVNIVNPILSGPAAATAGKTVRFAGRFLPAQQTAHLYQCWAEVVTTDDLATNCDTAGVKDQPYSATTVSIPVKMTKGTAPNLVNRVVLTVTSGPDTLVLKSRDVAVH